VIVEYLGGILTATVARPDAAPQAARRVLGSMGTAWPALLAFGQVQRDLLADLIADVVSDGGPSVEPPDLVALLDRRVNELHDEPWDASELRRVRERLRDLAAYELRLLTSGEQ
jgi:hypothetical protein